jgi:hypothetical protein
VGVWVGTPHDFQFRHGHIHPSTVHTREFHSILRLYDQQRYPGPAHSMMPSSNQPHTYVHVRERGECVCDKVRQSFVPLKTSHTSPQLFDSVAVT